MPQQQKAPEAPQAKSGFLADSAFLVAAVLCSALPYLRGLGFYSDDWAWLQTLVANSNNGLRAMSSALIASNPDLRIRPVQTLLLLLEFKAFHQSPFPYHLLATLFLCFLAVTLYLVLSEIGITRSLAFVLAIVFALLPHYATDRFWIASQQATLSLLFALLGIYALLRSARPAARKHPLWALLGILALAASLLSYEISVGLIAAALLAFAWRNYRMVRAGNRSSRFTPVTLAAATAVLLTTLLVKAHLQTRMAFHHHLFHSLDRLGGIALHAAVEAIQFNFWTYGLRLPHVLLALHRHAAISIPSAIVAAVVATSIAARLSRILTPAEIPSARFYLSLIGIGFLLFSLGYVLFSLDSDPGFSSPGIDNRVTIASALGAACILVALAALLASLARTSSVRIRVFSLVTGILCGANCLVIAGLGHFWDDAAAKQSAILSSVAAAPLAALPTDAVLLLDGFCPYSGPAVVFETDWDATGAIRIALARSTLRADVISPNLHFQSDAVETTIYGLPQARYPTARTCSFTTSATTPSRNCPQNRE